MKKIKYLFVCGVMAMSSLVVIGQESRILETEYWAALRKANDVRHNDSVRITKTGEYYEKGAVSEKSKLITEQIPPDRIRSFEQTTMGGKTNTTEAIEISDKSYCKENNKPWKITAYFCGPSGLSTAASNSVMSFYSSIVELEGKRVTLYRLLIREPSNPKAPQGFPDVFETKTWIDSDGRTVRVVTTTSLSSTGAVVYSGTELYEYNPKGLKIEAPIRGRIGQ